VGKASTHAVDGFFWFGIPVVSQRFSVDLPVAPGIGGTRTSVAQMLSAIQPALKDIAIVDDRLLLAGHADNTHWLAQWEETATQATGAISAMRLARPVFDIVAPSWLGSNAQVVTHLLYPDASALSSSARQARRPDQVGPALPTSPWSRLGRPTVDAGAWSSTSVWRVEGAARSLPSQIGQALQREGWGPSAEGSSGSLPTVDVWVKGRCTLAIQVLNDASAALTSQVWLRSNGHAQ